MHHVVMDEAHSCTVVHNDRVSQIPNENVAKDDEVGRLVYLGHNVCCKACDILLASNIEYFRRALQMATGNFLWTSNNYLTITV